MGKAGVEETRASTAVCNDSTPIFSHCSEIELVLVLVISFYKIIHCFAHILNPDMFQGLSSY